jgi:hypothetical protein
MESNLYGLMDDHHFSYITKLKEKKKEKKPPLFNTYMFIERLINFENFNFEK